MTSKPNIEIGYLTLDSEARVAGTVEAATFDITNFLTKFFNWKTCEISVSYYAFKNKANIHDVTRRMLVLSTNWSQLNNHTYGLGTFANIRTSSILIRHVENNQASYEFVNPINPEDRDGVKVIPSSQLTLFTTGQTGTPITAAVGMSEYYLVLAFKFMGNHDD